MGAVFGDNDIRKFDASGALSAQFDVLAEVSGSDWIDLAADQCTMFYTSEGKSIKRFDVCTNTQLTDFASIGFFSAAYALRILSDGGVLVASTQAILRFDALGNVVQNYDADLQNQWFALALDPDGTSFWAGDSRSGNFYKFDIATGAQVLPTPVSTGAALGGLAVFGELRPPPDASSPLILKRGKLRLDRHPHKDELFLKGSFVADPASIDPPTQGVTVTLTEGGSQIVEINIPAGRGWTTRRGPRWSFDRRAVELSIKYNAKKRLFELEVEIERAEFLMDPKAGSPSTSVIIGDQEFVNTQKWRSTSGGKKLVTP